MHEYDTTLKAVLTRPGCGVLTAITGCPIERWHNVELPEVRNLRVDLLGETIEGQLIHIELQRANDPSMILRMAEYALCIRRHFDRWPLQFVLYIGEAPLRMTARMETPTFSFACQIVDIREFDAEPFLASSHLADNIVAVLARLENERQSVRRILENIAESAPERRTLTLKELTILAGLRKLESVISQEAHTMPILDDIMDHDLFGPAIRQGLQQGREEGIANGERHLLLGQIGQRFGSPPAWVSQRLESLSAVQLYEVGLKLLKAENLEELLG